MKQGAGADESVRSKSKSSSEIGPNTTTGSSYIDRNELYASSSQPIGPATLRVMRQIMMNTLTPSWVPQLPSNFGSPTHGKIHADQWRALAMVFMPIAMVSIWSLYKFPPDVQQRMDDILENTMELFAAVHYATSLVTTTRHADMYEYHMEKYASVGKEIGTVLTNNPFSKFKYFKGGLYYGKNGAEDMSLSIVKASQILHHAACYEIDALNGLLLVLQLPRVSKPMDIGLRHLPFSARSIEDALERGTRVSSR